MTHNKILMESAQRILDFKNYVMCLHKKIAFLRVEYSSKTEKQKNDIAIEEYETLIHIAKCEKKVKEMQRVFESEILNPYLVDINRVIDDYENLIMEAQKLQERDFEMKHLLYDVNWKRVDESLVEKIKLYNEIKSHLDGKTEG